VVGKIAGDRELASVQRRIAKTVDAVFGDEFQGDEITSWASSWFFKAFNRRDRRVRREKQIADFRVEIGFAEMENLNSSAFSAVKSFGLSV